MDNNVTVKNELMEDAIPSTSGHVSLSGHPVTGDPAVASGDPAVVTAVTQVNQSAATFVTGPPSVAPFPHNAAAQGNIPAVVNAAVEGGPPAVIIAEVQGAPPAVVNAAVLGGPPAVNTGVQGAPPAVINAAVPGGPPAVVNAAVPGGPPAVINPGVQNAPPAVVNAAAPALDVGLLANAVAANAAIIGQIQQQLAAAPAPQQGPPVARVRQGAAGPVRGAPRNRPVRGAANNGPMRGAARNGRVLGTGGNRQPLSGTRNSFGLGPIRRAPRQQQQQLGQLFSPRRHQYQPMQNFFGGFHGPSLGQGLRGGYGGRRGNGRGSRAPHWSNGRQCPSTLMSRGHGFFGRRGFDGCMDPYCRCSPYH